MIAVHWMFFALSAAFFLATADALTKKGFSSLSAYEMGLTRLVYAGPWLLAALPFIAWPQVDKTFFLCIAALLPLETSAFLCYMRAIKVSPLSLSLPFLSFTPVFMLLTGRLLLGESVSLTGLTGVLCIVAGAYLLNLSKAKSDILAPFKAVFREPGSRLMLLVSFIYAVTSPLGKIAILHSSPCFFAVVYYLFLTVFILSLLPAVKGARLKSVLFNPRAGLMVGMMMALMITSHMISISMTQAVYMIAIKRTSAVFAVLYGAWVFHEEEITERFIGTIVMIVGVFLIFRFG